MYRVTRNEESHISATLVTTPSTAVPTCQTVECRHSDENSLACVTVSCVLPAPTLQRLALQPACAMRNAKYAAVRRGRETRRKSAESRRRGCQVQYLRVLNTHRLRYQPNQRQAQGGRTTAVGALPASYHARRRRALATRRSAQDAPGGRRTTTPQHTHTCSTLRFSRSHNEHTSYPKYCRVSAAAGSSPTDCKGVLTAARPCATTRVGRSCRC